MMKKKTVGIVGTGPAALMAGTVILENGHKVIFFDQEKTPGRKFLVAGNGGFNLTNDEEIQIFISRYTGDKIINAVKNFSNDKFRQFLLKIGIETFVGSSGKIFPMKGIKPIKVLQNWKNYLLELGAIFEMNHCLNDFSEQTLVFENSGKEVIYKFDKLVFSLGGGSWSKTGSNGKWLELFKRKGINCFDFFPSNSGFVISDQNIVIDFAGHTIKNCRISSANEEKMGDIVVTDYGVEGAPIYALNKSYRNNEDIYIDFKPLMTAENIYKKLQFAKNNSYGLKELKLSKVAIAWIKGRLTKDEYLDKSLLSVVIKSFKLNIQHLRPLDEVISTIGGIDLEEINDSFSLKSSPDIYCVGEMLNWDAPTGGYLIQGCVSSGYVAGKSIIDQS